MSKKYAGAKQTENCSNGFNHFTHPDFSLLLRARRFTQRVFLGQLISGHGRACAANQPIRLFQNVGICRLFSRKKADHHECRAK
jgi:hypothetical protein